MRRREEEDEKAPYLLCEKCQQMSERALIGECPYCTKDFCRACAVRSGSASYCSKGCAEAWFFSEADGESDDMSEE